MDTKGTLNDGREVLIRDMRRDDLEPLLVFFQSLPAEDRKYLRVDLTQPEVVAARLADIDMGRARRLVAVAGDVIVGDGALELEGHGWGDDVAEFRLIVSRPFQKLGLGTLLARELFLLAAASRVERIVARFLTPPGGGAADPSQARLPRGVHDPGAGAGPGRALAGRRHHALHPRRPLGRDGEPDGPGGLAEPLQRRAGVTAPPGGRVVC